MNLFTKIRGFEGLYPWAIFLFLLGILLTIAGTLSIAASGSYAVFLGGIRPFIALLPLIFLIIYFIIGICLFKERVLYESLIYIVGCYIGLWISLIIGVIMFVISISNFIIL